jgi:hypothetical protein
MKNERTNQSKENIMAYISKCKHGWSLDLCKICYPKDGATMTPTMTPTNKLRFVKRVEMIENDPVKMMAIAKPVCILQQWWEGFGSDTAINYAHPDAYKLSKNPPGEWRDVEVVDERT